MIKTYLFTENEVKEDVSIEDWRGLPSDRCKLLWVDVRSCDQADLESLASEFGLHSVAVQSCMDHYHRPHVYEFSDHFYVNMTALKQDPRGKHGVKPSELHLFVGENYLITVVKEAQSEPVDKALDSFKDTPGMCARGTMFAVYLLAEDLVETYIPLVERLDNEADKIETLMLDRPDKRSLAKLFALKSRAFEFRKLLGPQRDVLSELARRDYPFERADSRIYFQDVYNRMIRLFDMLDTTREILSGCLDIYLSTVSNRLNEVMKVLTVLATILGLSTLVTGFFGMNFSQLPWLDSPNAFRNMLVFMGSCSIAMLILFKWKKWL